MSNKNSTGVSVGSISLLVIFLVLCMSIFAVLSLTTAKAELRLSEKSAQAIKDYYAADLICMERIQRLQDLLDQGAGSSGIVAETMVFGGTAAIRDGIVHIEFSQPIMDGQDLRVELAVANGNVSIVGWKSVDVGPWEPDYSLNVWEGNLP